MAKMNVLFDKEPYEKGRSLGESSSRSNKLEMDEGKVIEKAIKDSLASGKVGALSVDPNFLDFEPLGGEGFDLMRADSACSICTVNLSLFSFLLLVYQAPEESFKSRLAAYFQLSEVRLYTILGCIAALVIVALLQATCTIMKSKKKRTHRQKVSSRDYCTRI